MLALVALTDILLYPLTALNKKARVPLNIWHNIERNMLWVVLVLGESLISIVLPVLPCECEVSTGLLQLATGVGPFCFRTLMNLWPGTNPYLPGAVPFLHYTARKE